MKRRPSKRRLIKVRLLVWHLVQSGWRPYKKGKLGYSKGCRDVKTQRKDHVGEQQRVPVCKTRRETLGETNPAGPLILDSRPPKLGTKQFLLCKPPSLWAFIVAALADSYSDLQGSKVTGSHS